MARPKPNGRAGKAAILTELLGADRVAALRHSGALPDIGAEGEADPGTVAWHRNRLIQKFRARGLLGPQDGRAAAGTGPRVAGANVPKVPRKDSDSRGSAEGGRSAGQDVKAPRDTGEGAANPRFRPGGIGARVVSLLDPDRLCDEHPAVVALLLRSQDPKLRSEVLRGLPGAQARAVMRHLRSDPSKARSAAAGPGPS